MCPTGCGAQPRPYDRRTEAVRCANCTAWYAAPAAAEDGSLVAGVLLARPGEGLPAAAPARRLRWMLAAALAALALLAALAALGFYFHAGVAP